MDTINNLLLQYSKHKNDVSIYVHKHPYREIRRRIQTIPHSSINTVERLILKKRLPQLPRALQPLSIPTDKQYIIIALRTLAHASTTEIKSSIKRLLLLSWSATLHISSCCQMVLSIHRYWTISSQSYILDHLKVNLVMSEFPKITTVSSHKDSYFHSDCRAQYTVF